LRIAAAPTPETHATPEFGKKTKGLETIQTLCVGAPSEAASKKTPQRPGRPAVRRTHQPALS
jgi:hypothetical protein